MTDLLTQVRNVALQLPGAKERATEHGAEFTVEGEPFARVNGDGLSVLGDEGWNDRAAAGALDPTFIDDMVAHGWELAASTGLLEAGGQ
jgi:hypothetical protein